MGLVLTLMPSLAFAQSVSLYEMFASFSNSAIALMNLVRWVALPAGIIISIQGIMKLKEVGDNGGRTSIRTPIMLLLVGIFLFSFPIAVSITTESLSLGAGTGTVLSRVPNTGGAPGVAPAMRGVLLFVKLIGHIAFFRGFLLFYRNAKGDGQATFGKAMIFLLAGAACINIDSTIMILAKSIAPGLSPMV